MTSDFRKQNHYIQHKILWIVWELFKHPLEIILLVWEKKQIIVLVWVSLNY